MLTKAELISLVKDKKLECFEVLSAIKKDNAIELSSLEAVLNFASMNAIRSVFYYYTYATKDTFLIGEDALFELRMDDEDIIELLSERIEKYNSEVVRSDYSKPISLCLFCVFQGFEVFFSEYDDWFIKQGFDSPESKLFEFRMEVSDEEIEEVGRKSYSQFEERKEKLKSCMLKDEAFKRCTNQDLRRDYCRQLKKKDNALARLFVKNGASLFAFAESVWKEYKANK